MRSPGLARRRIWLVCEAPEHLCRAMQRARNSILGRASALRPLAAAFLSVAGTPGPWRAEMALQVLSREVLLNHYQQQRYTHQ
jgi:hypothetical protein